MNIYDRAMQAASYYNIDETVYELFKKSFINMPVIHKKDEYCFRKADKSKPPGKLQRLDDEDKAVLETIYVGKCMTHEQLMIFLYLKGYKVSSSKIKTVLDKMVFHQLIQRIDVSEKSDKENHKIKYYLIGNYTPCKEMGIPNVTMKKLYILRRECGSVWPLYCISMQIINQIALCHILSGQGIERFLIGEVRIDRDYQLTMPLVIFSENSIIAFVFVSYMDSAKADEIIMKWKRYGRAIGREIKLILITRDDVQQLYVRRCVENMDSAGMKIGFSDYRDWFSETDNKVYIKIGPDALMG